VKFDYYLLNTYLPAADGDAPAVYSKWIEQIVTAEELGFTCAWFTEHHFSPFGGMLPNPPMFMSALAQRTQRIRLGTAVTMLTFYNPIRVVEDACMLDVLSSGRVDLGIGRGMDAQYHPVFGVDIKTSQARFDESVEMVKAALRDEPFTWDGQFFQCPDPITILPRPVQQPHPPIWVPNSKNPAHSRAIGRAGVNLMTLPWAPETFAETRVIIDEYRAGMVEAGHPEGRFQVMGYMSAYCGETPERARADAEPYWEAARNLTDELRPEGSTMAARKPFTYEAACSTGRAILGDVAQCREHVQRVQEELGIDRLALRFDYGGMPQELVLASMRRFAEEVAPAFTD
jgi:alkanesulfonate monooxygenase SsuD/methylene tetrahydromethanopterin reductase-like flavin-dependent oxidoreductase (luciferase family)